MTDEDVMVATPPEDSDEGRPDRSLVEQARADGVDLVGPDGLLAGLTKQVLEAGLEVEMDEHLGYEKHAVEGRNLGNSRNGTRSKTVLTEIGPVEVDVPRDRDSSFDPQTVRKGQRRLDGVDSMVISLTAKGLTTGEVEAHLAEVYSTTISRETISKITDRVLGELAEWQTRPLDRGRFLAVVANHGLGGVSRKSDRTSCGVRSPSTWRGRSLSSAATWSRSARLCAARLVPFGKY
jgi:Transposase, Mutator family